MSPPDVQKIGKYEILAELGQGGFGRVYRAFDPTVGRPVAIKILTAEGNKDLLTRFRNEATAAGNLRHRNIVTVYDYGEYNGRPYLVMELLEGEDLTQIITNHTPLSLLQKMTIMDQIAAGLDCAHQHGVLHRDVKPANIRILPDGTVKIMDFGIARVNSDRNATRLTQQGDLIGTILYMSPEQFGGSEADALCDIFAYGLIYFELLTGKHPFRSSDPRTVMFRITMSDPEPLRTLEPECPEGLERILNRALQKDRELRYQSLRDLQLDTEPLIFELKQARARELVADAVGFSDGRDSRRALQLINEALNLDPSNREARQLRENVQRRIQKDALQPRIELLLQSAQDQLTQRSFTQAVQTLESASKLDQTDDHIRELLENARERMNRSKDAAALVVAAFAQLGREEWLAAAETKREAARIDSQNPDLILIGKEIEKHIQLTLAKVDSHIEDDDLLELVIGDLNDLANLQPESPDIQSRLAAVKVRQEAHSRIQAVIGSARELMGNTRFDEALHEIGKALQLYPNNRSLIEMGIEAKTAKEARDRTLLVQQALLDCSRCRQENRLEDALKFADGALKEYPDEQVLLDLKAQLQQGLHLQRRAAAVRRELEAGQHLLELGQPAEAVDALRKASGIYPESEELQQQLARAREALDLQQHRQKVQRAAAEAQRRAGQQDFAGAIQHLEQALESSPHEKELEDLLRTTRQAHQEWQLAQALKTLGQQCDLLIHEGRLEQALEKVRAGLEALPGQAALMERRDQLLELLENQHRLSVVRNALAAGGELLKQGEPASAIEVLASASSQYPETDLLNLLDQARAALRSKQQREAVAKALAEATRNSECDDFSGALRILQTAIEEWPEQSATLADALQKVREEQRDWERRNAVARVAQESRALAREHRCADAMRVIEAGLSDYPLEPILLDLRRELQTQLEGEQRAEALRRASHDSNSLLQQGRAEEAVHILTLAAGRYPEDETLELLLRKANQALQSQRRREAINKAAADARGLRDGEDFVGAIAVLEDALKSWPGEDQLIVALREMQAARILSERRRAVHEAVQQAASLIAQNRKAEALDIVQAGLRNYSGEPELSRLEEQLGHRLETEHRAAAVDQAVTTGGQLLEQGRVRQAIEVLAQACSEYSDDSRLVQLLARAREILQIQQTREAVERITAEAQRRVEHKDFAGAIGALVTALKSWPHEQVLSDLLSDTRKAQQHWERHQAVLEVARQAKALVDANNLRDALKKLKAGSRKHGADPLLTDLGAQIERQLAGLQRESPEKQPDAPKPSEVPSAVPQGARQPFSRRYLFLGGMAAVVALAAVAIPRLSPGGRGVALTLNSNVSGASVSIGGQTCVLPDCNLKLPAGNYRLVAAKDGFDSIARPLFLDRNTATISVPLVFSPLPQLIQVNTNFETGRVLLDGTPAGDLRDGQFSLDRVPPGNHTIRVTGSDAEFEARWRGEPGAPPRLTQPISARNVRATLLANAGQNAMLACNCDTGTIQVDGNAVTSSPALNLKNGVRRINVADRSLVVDVRPNPTLSIFLSLDRNVGTLVIDTGQDNATVYLNDRPYRRLTEHGLLRIPAEVGEYSVRVEKPGFRTSAAKTAVAKGEEKQISLPLTQLSASLEISGALPNAVVRLDGKPIGETAENGTLRTEVTPGDHEIELVKDNYNTVRFGARFPPGQTIRPRREQLIMARVIQTPPPPDPRQLEAQDWEKLRNSNSIEELDDFIRRHPAGTYTENARTRISQLQQQARVDAARQAEQSEWDSLDKGRKAAIQDFLARHSNGPHQQEARALLAEIEKREADLIAAARITVEPPKPVEPKEKDSEPAARNPSDQQSVTRTLGQYEVAYNAKDLASLHRIWPGMPKAVSDALGAQFRYSRTIAFQLRPLAAAAVNGDSATITCTRSLNLTTIDNQRVNSGNERVQVTLDRAGSNWVIRSVVSLASN